MFSFFNNAQSKAKNQLKNLPAAWRDSIIYVAQEGIKNWNGTGKKLKSIGLSDVETFASWASRWFGSDYFEQQAFADDSIESRIYRLAAVVFILDKFDSEILQKNQSLILSQMLQKSNESKSDILEVTHITLRNMLTKFLKDKGLLIDIDSSELSFEIDSYTYDQNRFDRYAKADYETVNEMKLIRPLSLCRAIDFCLRSSSK